MSEKKQKKSLTSFTILFIIIAIVAIATQIVANVAPESGVVGAHLYDFFAAPVKGFGDALDVCVFVLILGGFLGTVTKTGALDNGIAVLVKKLHGRELVLIPILMTLFSLGGSTYGMLEETVPFYLLLASTMVSAGFDSIVGASMVLLGAGSGCLGSTINPFAVGAAQDAALGALGEGATLNSGYIIVLGLLLWASTLLISIFFVMTYAKKVKADKGSCILSLQEQEEMKAEFIDKKKEESTEAKLTGRQKTVLCLFALTFVIMIIGFIPLESFGITAFNVTAGWITEYPLGTWYFQEASIWFLLMGIIIGVVGGIDENTLVDTFLAGVGDMVGVVMIIALARGVSVLMGVTGLDAYILASMENVLRGVPAWLFAPVAYLLYIPLSFLVPSSSGLATVSMPIMAPLAASLEFAPEVMIMIFVAGNGLVNLFTPTCGAIMGGLAIAKIQYSTWIKFATKIIVTIAVVNIVILTVAMMVL